MDDTKDSAQTPPSVSLEAVLASSGDPDHVSDLPVKLETEETSSLPSPSSMRDSDDEAEKEDEEERCPFALPSSPSSTSSPQYLLASPLRHPLFVSTPLSTSLDANEDVQVVKEVITIDSGSEDEDEDDDDDPSSAASSSQSSHGYPRYHRYSTDEGEDTDNSDLESDDDEEDDEDDDHSRDNSSSSSSAAPPPAPILLYDMPTFPPVHNFHQMQMQSEWMMNAHDQIRRASSAAGVLPATYSFTSSAFPHTTLHPSSSTSMSSPSASSSSSSAPVPVSVSSPSPVSISSSSSPPPLSSSPSFFPFAPRDISMSDRRDHWATDSRAPPSSSLGSSSSTSPSSSSSSSSRFTPMTPMGVPMPFPFPSRPATMTTTTTTTRRMSPVDFPHFMPGFGPPTPMMPHPFIDLSSDQPPERLQRTSPEFLHLTSTSISSFSPFDPYTIDPFPFVHMPPGPPHLFLHPHSHPHVHTHSRDHSHRRHHHHHHRPHTTVHPRPLPHALHQLQFRDISSEDYEMLRMMEASSSGSSSAGACQRKIQALPVSKVTEEESGKHACCICLDDMLKDDMVKRLPCSHYFHQKCIDEWLQTKQECPLDKKNPFASPVQK